MCFLSMGYVPAGYCIDDKGQIIGRIAAFINYEKANKHPEPTGGSGFFDCINDKKAAFLLLDTAKAWLQGQRHGSHGRAY